MLFLGRLLVACFLLALFAQASAASGQPAQEEDRQRDQRIEEVEDYFDKWLNEDVIYIITAEERRVFESLTTPEEKEQFIEQFWLRRDPDLRTPNNEFKEEHYRRLAYANERFQSGVPGWKTDRGRIYIIHGPPVEIQSFKSGAAYDRPSHEGGGFTRTFPFEIWRYHHIEGIGTDVELEFVDPSGSGEFRLARTPWEKDAFLFTPGTAVTVAEEMGLARRQDHPYFSPATADMYPAMNERELKDNPFIRYETYIQVQRPQDLKYRDLQQLIDVNIQYDSLPYRVRSDYFRLNSEHLLAPITVEVDNRELNFRLENGVYVARVAVYGLVSSMTNRVVAEFEHDLVVSFQPDFFKAGLEGRSVYQKVVGLAGKMRYKLDLVVKDLHSEKVGLQRIGLVPPAFPEDRDLAASSVVLSDYVRSLDQVPQEEEMFVLGDVKVRPAVENSFQLGKPIWVYFHVYNAGLDQANLKPALSVKYQLFRDGEKVAEMTDESGESTQFFSGRRIVLLKQLPSHELGPGEYKLRVDVTDRISRQSKTLEDEFTVRAG